MIKADLPELETLSVLMNRAASLSDELQYQIKNVINEMHADTVLMSLPEYVPVSQALDRAFSVSALTNDTLSYLSRVLTGVAGEYEEMEREGSDRVRNILSALTENAAVFSSSMDPLSVPVPESCYDTDASSRVSGMFAGIDDVPETVNISGVRETVESEYLLKDGE